MLPEERGSEEGEEEETVKILELLMKMAGKTWGIRRAVGCAVWASPILSETSH